MKTRSMQLSGSCVSTSALSPWMMRSTNSSGTKLTNAGKPASLA